MKLIFLIELIFCVQKVFYVLTMRVQMRDIQNDENFDVGQVFIDFNEVNSFEKLIYERYFSIDYKTLCNLMDYTLEEAKVFPCRIKGFQNIQYELLYILSYFFKERKGKVI